MKNFLKLVVLATLLQQVADITSHLMTQKSQASGSETSDSSAAEKTDRFAFEQKPDRLLIIFSNQPVAEFVFDDAKVLRPYFSQLHTFNGLQVTRNHPPVEGTDAIDHDTMHPGLWLGFGDINGVDFWRNKGSVKLIRFSEPPTVQDNCLTFATESELITPNGETLCQLACRYTMTSRAHGWLLVWDATFRSNDQELVFGDQEEMGFGARVATSLAEKNGGVITSSTGRTSAALTWGQPAAWCDYSGTIGDQKAGITLMTSPRNFRESWWHNRDYGVFVANPFGRAAMKQGEASATTIQKGESFHVCFAAFLHDGSSYNPVDGFNAFTKQITD